MIDFKPLTKLKRAFNSGYNQTLQVWKGIKTTTWTGNALSP